MKQQIRIFEYITRLKISKDIPIILLLNKTDVLEQFLTKDPISDYFQEYTAGANCFQACKFFADKFAKSDCRLDGDLRIYGTCAVQESCFQETLEELQILSRSDYETDPSDILGGEASVQNPVSKPSMDKMLRKYNQENFSEILYPTGSVRGENPPVSYPKHYSARRNLSKH